MRASIACVLLGSAAASSNFRAPQVDPVTAVNVTKYLGRWYQMYDDAIVQDTFENRSVCDTADYGTYPNGTISVYNRERIGSVDGPEDQIFGWAEVKDPSKPGELVVHLQTTHFGAPYWVYKLGLETYGPDGLYQYSIVSDPFQATLFVLARNVTEFYSLWQPEVDAFLAKNGWDKIWNKPHATTQIGCTYWE